MRWLFLALLLVSSVSAYHGWSGYPYYNPGAGDYYSRFDYYGSSLYGHGYRSTDNYYTYFYPFYERHAAVRYSGYSHPYYYWR